MSAIKTLKQWPAVLTIVMVIALGTLALSSALGTTARVCSGVENTDCTAITNRNGLVLLAGSMLIVGVAIASRVVQRQADPRS